MVWHLQSGVRQGGVLSPVLCNVYIRFMLDELELSDVGCHKDHVYAVAYLGFGKGAAMASARSASLYRGSGGGAPSGVQGQSPWSRG